MVRTRSILWVFGLTFVLALALASPVAAWDDPGHDAGTTPPKTSLGTADIGQARPSGVGSI